MEKRKSGFVVGNEVSVSELAKYWGPILKSGRRVQITIRGIPTHVLVPVSDSTEEDGRDA